MGGWRLVAGNGRGLGGVCIRQYTELHVSVYIRKKGTLLREKVVQTLLEYQGESLWRSSPWNTSQ